MTHCAHHLCAAPFDPPRPQSRFCSVKCQRAHWSWCRARGQTVIDREVTGNFLGAIEATASAAREYKDARNSRLLNHTQSGKK